MGKVAVTGMNAGDSPAPGAPVIRSLRAHPRWEGGMIGLGYDVFESGILDRALVDSAYLIPYPSAGKDALLERIRSIHALECLDLIIPNLDSEILNFIAIQDELERMGIRVFLPTEEQFKLRSKVNLPQFSEKFGVRVPKTVVVSDASSPLLQGCKFPVVVKGPYYEAYVAHQRDSAMRAIQQVAASWGYPVLIQEYVAGQEYNVAAVGDGTGRTVELAAMKKLVFTDKKKGWACVSIEYPALQEFARTVVKHLKWKGPLEIEVIQSREDGEFHVIEINPRFPAWIYLAQAAGANLPYTLYCLACGLPLESVSVARAGVVFTNYTTNLVTDLATISSLFTAGELHHEKSL